MNKIIILLLILILISLTFQHEILNLKSKTYTELSLIIDKQNNPDLKVSEYHDEFWNKGGREIYLQHLNGDITISEWLIKQERMVRLGRLNKSNKYNFWGIKIIEE